MTRPLPPLGCAKHPHAFRFDAECSGCWAERNAAKLARTEARATRKANPTSGGWAPIPEPKAGREWL